MKYAFIFILLFNYILAEEIYISEKRYSDSIFSGLFDNEKQQRIYGVQKFDNGFTFFGTFEDDEANMGIFERDGEEYQFQATDETLGGYKYFYYGSYTSKEGVMCYGYFDDEFTPIGYRICERNDTDDVKTQECFLRDGKCEGEYREIRNDGEIWWGNMLNDRMHGDAYYLFSNGDTYKYSYRKGNRNRSNGYDMTYQDNINLKRIQNVLDNQFETLNEKWNTLLETWDNFVALVNKDTTQGSTTRNNEKSNLILSIQELLTELGYSPGPSDGKMGQKTSSAIKAFQVTHDMEVDGLASEKLLVALQVVLQSFRVPEDNNSNNEKKNQKLSSTGSGFYINDKNIVTNYHVVEECDNLKDSDESPLKIIIIDEMNDLVILEGPRTKQSLRISPNAPALGEEIYVAGFPLYSSLKGLNFTSGNVSALKGYGQASSQFQFTAPTQPGNSGGPILNRYGSVIGIVVAGLKSDTLMRERGTVVQNANFGIKNTILKGLMDDNKINYKSSDAFWSKSQENLASIASENSVLIRCYGN